MTRKDYVLIAAALKAEKDDATSDQARALQRLANRFALELARDNPRFDRERFLKACGFSST